MDQIVVEQFHAWFTLHPGLAPVTAAIAEGGIFIVPLILGLLWFLPRPDRPGLRQAVIAGVLAGILTFAALLVLGEQFARVRPFVALGFTPLVPHAADSSFPSDHTLLGMALVVPLLWIRPGFGTPLALWVLVVGGARVASGLHYPSDVIGSAFLAILPGALAYGACSGIRKTLQ